MPPDTSSQAPHHDAAGWALGALDPADAEKFETHLHDCAECQTAVAQFQPVVRALMSPAPAVEPPPELEAKTLASVQQAVLAARQAGQADDPKRTAVTWKPSQPAQTSVLDLNTARAKPAEGRPPGPAPAKMSRWWHRHSPLLSVASALAGAAVAVAAVVLIPLLQTAPAIAATIPMHSPSGGAASGQAKVQRVAGGFLIHVTVRGLKSLGPGQVYECWYNRPGTGQWITAGSFRKSGSFVMTSAADPHVYTVMKIILEQAGDPRPTGKPVLSGRATGA